MICPICLFNIADTTTATLHRISCSGCGANIITSLFHGFPSLDHIFYSFKLANDEIRIYYSPRSNNVRIFKESKGKDISHTIKVITIKDPTELLPIVNKYRLFQ